jgi:hypothetical protein
MKTNHPATLNWSRLRAVLRQNYQYFFVSTKALTQEYCPDCLVPSGFYGQCYDLCKKIAENCGENIGVLTQITAI